VSSLKLVEQAKPVVGITALQAIGRALGKHFPDWTQDTPRAILEGAAPPAVKPAADPRISPVLTSHPDDPLFWKGLADEVPKDKFDELWKIYLDHRKLREELSRADRAGRLGILDHSTSDTDGE